MLTMIRSARETHRFRPALHRKDSIDLL